MTAPDPHTAIRTVWLHPLTRRARLHLAWHDACDTAADGAIRALGVCAGCAYDGVRWGVFLGLLGALFWMGVRFGEMWK